MYCILQVQRKCTHRMLENFFGAAEKSAYSDLWAFAERRTEVHGIFYTITCEKEDTNSESENVQRAIQSNRARVYATRTRRCGVHALPMKL